MATHGLAAKQEGHGYARELGAPAARPVVARHTDVLLGPRFGRSFSHKSRTRQIRQTDTPFMV